MVAANDEMTATEIFPAQSSKQGFSWPSISGKSRKNRKNDFISRIKIFNHFFVTGNNIFRLKISWLFFANYGMNK